MKKIYSIILCLSVFGTVNAQKINRAEQQVTKQDNFSTTVKPSAQTESKGALLWEDSFADESLWNITIDGVNPAGWEFSTDPAVIPVGALSPMASTTASDGFLFVNSDGNNSTDFEGTPIVTNATLVTPIDLTGSEFVKLSFQHNY